jgi:hypothetical protein
MSGKLDGAAITLGSPVQLCFLSIEPVALGASRSFTLSPARNNPYAHGIAPLDRWTASIKIDERLFYLGSFADAESAANAYDKSAEPLGRAVNFKASGDGGGDEGAEADETEKEEVAADEKGNGTPARGDVPSAAGAESETDDESRLNV